VRRRVGIDGGGLGMADSPTGGGDLRMTDDARRIIAFGGVCAVGAAVALAYARDRYLETSKRAPRTDSAIERLVTPSARAAPEDAPPADAAPAAHSPADGVTLASADEPTAPLVLVRHTGLDRDFGALAVARLGTSGVERVAPLHCDRVHFAAGRGVCLTTSAHYTRHATLLFDDRFDVRHTLALGGLPSRVRVSSDGRLAATTVFVSGHDYTSDAFSTETRVIDLVGGTVVVGNVQDLTVTRDGLPFMAEDFNVWGITFAGDSDRFYATLGTAGETYLVEGRIAARQMRVLRAGVECPSLSPDGTRIAFKRRVGPASAPWRIHILDLATLEDHAVAETRSVDDQVEWLDDRTVLYAIPREAGPAGVLDVWASAADGSGAPRLAVAAAASPAVVR
jgi:hypothetical protein